MAVCILVDEKRQAAYKGMREILPGTVVVDWSDLQNPDMSVILMDIDRATITKKTLELMGYETEILFMSQDAPKPNWLFYGAVAFIVGYVVATVLF